MKKQTDKNFFQNAKLIAGSIVVLLSIAGNAFAQTPAAGQNDTQMLDSFIKSQGYYGIISFDSANIKQFWIDKTVLSKNDLINISLDDKQSSVPLKIQLANVNVSDDCKVDVFTDDPNVSFSITNSSARTLSSSRKEDDFIHYHVLSSAFHLEEAKDFSFNMIFKSKDAAHISIKRIVLSFSHNQLYLKSPGTLAINRNNTTVNYSNLIGADGFTVKGKRTEIWSNNKILINDNIFKTKIKVKNTGSAASRIYTGFAVYSDKNIKLDGKLYPYNNASPILNVVSAEKGSSVITVDSFSGWTKGCYLALNADRAFADIPNGNLVDGTIVDVKTVRDGVVEITMSKPLTNEIKKGTNVRIHGMPGSNLYTNTKELQPGEEETFTAELHKDDNYPFYYSTKLFSKGSYYAVP